MYYPRFTKVIIHHFMSKDPSILRRNKVNWHYVRDDHMFTTIKLVSKHRNTQQFGATPPKPKASVRKMKSSSDTTVTPPPTAAAGPRLSTSAKGKQPAKASEAKSLTALFEVAMTEAQQLKLATKRSPLSTHAEEETRDEESFDPIPKTPKNTDDEGNGEENLGINVDREEGHDEKEEEDELYKDFTGAVSSIPKIVQRYMDQRMNKVVKVAIQIQSDRLRDEAQVDNDEFLKTIDENMQKIIKEQVKEQVKVQVSKILPKIEQTMNEQLEAEVLTRSSNSSKTSYRNLYKALVEAYESDKIILDTYEETVTLKRHRDDDADKDEEPSARSDRGSKRRIEGKEPESATSESATAEEPMQTTFKMEDPSHLEFDIGDDDQPIVESSQHPEWFSQQKKPPTLDHDWNKTLPATHESIQPLVELEFLLEEVYKATTDQLDLVNPEGQQYPHNLLKPLPLIPNNRGRRVIPFDHFINNDLEYLHGGASSRKYTTSVTKTKAVLVAEGSTETSTERYMENYKNVAQDIHDQLNAEAEAVQIILTGIDNDIYSTFDACPNACEMWKAIERLEQGESINVQDLETSLYWEFGKFTSRDDESLESYYSRFYKTMNELVRNQCDVTNHQVNVQGKAVVNSHPPIYVQEPTIVVEDDEMSKDKEIDKLVALISLPFKKIYKPTNNNLRTSSNTSRANHDNSPRINRRTGYDNQRIFNVVGARENVGITVMQQSGIQCYNCKEYGHVARECQKSKLEKDAAYHKKKMLLCKQEEAGIQLNAEQADWRDDTDDEPDDQELEAHYIKNRNKFLETSNKALVDKLKGEIKDFKT
nr:hypothetical protein [Tanacetum cinerariifolium]